jgi:hypothetical protein
VKTGLSAIRFIQMFISKFPKMNMALRLAALCAVVREMQAIAGNDRELTNT